jgi:hypothetical protein
MSTTEIAIFVGVAGLTIASQWGRHAVSLRRFLLPLIVVGVVASQYLHSLPTAGGDLDFEAICTLAGVAFGALAACLVNVERDRSTGQIVLEAGVAYATVWLAVFGARLAFGWAASNAWRHQVMLFSLQHEITSSAAWTAAFVFMAISMVATRTFVLGGRALLVSRTLSTA